MNALPPVRRCFSRTVARPGNLSGLRAWVAGQAGGVMLESVAHDERWGRYSVFAVRPSRVIEIADADPCDPFVALADACRPWSIDSGRRLPFHAGWIGYVAYEAGRFVEPRSMNALRASGMPLSWWGYYGCALVVDHCRDEWYVAGEVDPSHDDSADKVRFWQTAIAEADGFVSSDSSLALAQGQWHDSREDYLENVRRIVDYIRAGDVFQVNLARRYRVRCAASPAAIYQRLCETNPAVYSAYLSGVSGDWSLLSSSPELFLAVNGREVVTRPIKGTRPRGATPDADLANRRMLLTSDKDRAELNMIIDLLRNDIGRVCEAGTVRVQSDGDIEALPTVFHRTATIAGRLREDADSLDLLRACFPGGSISGAPKVRAMQIIHELEPFARGPYCGAIGYIGVDGAMQLNIPIRTMTRRGDTLDLFVGSGIVADSDPEAEYDELTAKAAGMMAALHGTIPTMNGRPAELHGAAAR
ncbi:MAG: aminodeoxychorismate synthase component I [Planctomycetes bacterium]|nr:aminodeoxychorismate synthase component I [Planctomycetota bacterium]